MGHTQKRGSGVTLAPQSKQIPSLNLATTLALAALAWLAPACTIQMVHRDPKPPSPLKGLSNIAATFDYSGLSVGGMELNAYLAKKTAEDPAYAKSWADLTAALENNFLQGLQSGWGATRRLAPGERAAPNEAELIVAPASLHIGHFIPFATSNTEVKTTMRWQVNGQVAEVQEASGHYTPRLDEPSVFQHIRPIGLKLGGDAAGFMRKMQR